MFAISYFTRPRDLAIFIFLAVVAIIVAVTVVYYKNASKNQNVTPTIAANTTLLVGILFTPQTNGTAYVNIRNIVAFDANGKQLTPIPSSLGSTQIGPVTGDASNIFSKSNTTVQKFTLAASTGNGYHFQFAYITDPNIYQIAVTYERQNAFTWTTTVLKPGVNGGGVGPVTTANYTPSQSTSNLDTINYYPKNGSTFYENNGAPAGFTNYMA